MSDKKTNNKVEGRFGRLKKSKTEKLPKEEQTTDNSPSMFFRKTFIDFYLPTLLFEFTVGTILPVIPNRVISLGGNIAIASLTVSMLTIGQLFGDVPAGMVAKRFGDRTALIIGGVGDVILLAVCAFASDGLVFCIGIFFLGFINSIFLLARQACITEVANVNIRSQVLALLGACQRTGYVVGPFIGSAIIYFTSVDTIFYLSIATTCLICLILIFYRSELGMKADELSKESNVEKLKAKGAVADTLDMSTKKMLHIYKKMVYTLGIGLFTLGAVRALRQALIPLWCEYLTMSPEVTSFITGISGLFDLLLVVPCGYVMDHFGRYFVAVPSILLMGLGLTCLPFCTTPLTISICVAVIGGANGMSTGILMTLSADMSPNLGRSVFLSIPRVMNDSGGSIGPLLASLFVAIINTPIAIILGSLLGYIGCVYFSLYVPKWTRLAFKNKDLSKKYPPVEITRVHREYKEYFKPDQTGEQII